VWQRVRAWSASPGGRIWVDAAQIWVLTRAVFLALTYLVPSLLTQGSGFGGLLTPLTNWATQDGAQYVYIAQHGYDVPWRTNFWPLFPLLGHIAAPAFGGNYALALMFIANGAFFGALFALRSLAERELGAEAAYRAALYLAIFPTAFYFFAPYTESLFLCFAIASCALMRQRRWWLAGLLGGLAVLTRSWGILLLAPFAVELFIAWRQGKARWYQACTVLPLPAAVAIYSAYCQQRFHDPLAFSHANGISWRDSLVAPWQAVAQIAAGMGQLGAGSPIRSAHFVLNLGITLAFLAVVVVSWRRLPLSYTAFALAVFAYLLLFMASAPTQAVTGNGRYMLVVFPVFMVLGAWGRRPWVHQLLLVGMLPLLALLCAHYLLGLATA
jgi:hypothetical protein